MSSNKNAPVYGANKSNSNVGITADKNNTNKTKITTISKDYPDKWKFLHLLISRGKLGVTGNEARIGVLTPDGYAVSYFLNSLVPKLNTAIGYSILTEKERGNSQDTTRYWIGSLEHAQRAVEVLQRMRRKHGKPPINNATVKRYLDQYREKVTA